MNVHLVQFDIQWENRAGNHGLARQMLDVDKPAPGSLVILPEMFATGFSMNPAATCQGAGLEDEAFLRSLAEAYDCTVLGGVTSPLRDGKVQNMAVVVQPGGEPVVRYAKQQLFTPAGEDRCHLEGREVVTFPWGGFQVAPFICYDLRFPEHFRTAAEKEADLMIVIASWPARRQYHWDLLLKARAIENQAFVIGVNRCGEDPHAIYEGGSQVVSPRGHLIADAGGKPQVLSAWIEPSEVRAWREEFPVLRDMKR